MRPENPTLAALLRDRFIPVRLTSLKGVDINQFRFDYDLTFAGLVMTPDGATLARWGSRDGGPDATNRVSVNQLIRVLQRTASQPWPSYKAPPAQTVPEKFPAFAKRNVASEPCYHCHYAHDAALIQARAENVFTKALLFRYPLPENVGLSLAVDHGNRIASVTPGSAAAAAGLHIGDDLIRAAGQPIYTTADLQWVLDPLPDTGAELAITFQRAGKTYKTTLYPKPGWRVTDISWRPSQGGIPPVLGIWEEPLDTARKKALGIGADDLGLRVSFLFPGEKWKPMQGDLRINDVIIAADGKTLPAMTARQFHTWIRLNKEVGQTIRLTVLRNGERLELPISCRDPGEL